MAASGPTEMNGQQDRPPWLLQIIEAFRLRGYLTMFVRIGYELVLIVSGPLGEAAIVDFSCEPRSLWKDAWTGMRQVLPRMPVVAVVPRGESEGLSPEDQVPLVRVADPVDPDKVIRAVEQLLRPPGTAA